MLPLAGEEDNPRSGVRVRVSWLTIRCSCSHRMVSTSALIRTLARPHALHDGAKFVQEVS
jgi:hypothetical protein